MRGQSSDPAIVETAPPDALLSEADLVRQLKFRVKGTGDTVLRVPQPDGFTSAPDAGLRVHVFERELSFEPSFAVNPAEVTVTSGDPRLVLVSADLLSTGAPSMRLPGPSSSVHLHGMADSGTATVTFEAPGRTPFELTVGLQPLQYWWVPASWKPEGSFRRQPR